MIAAGIALSTVTAGAGMGVVASAIIGGTGMTATSAALFHEGIDTGGDLVGGYGKDLAVNIGTMGAARYAQAARYLYEAKRAGDVTKGWQHMRTVWGGGTQFLNSVDEMAQIGSKLPLTGRLAAATVEGLTDVATGTGIETALEGGNFVNNLVENAMFMGLGYSEFVGPAVRGLKNATAEQVQKAFGITNKISENWTKLTELCRRSGQDPQDILQQARTHTDVSSLTPEEQELIRIVREIDQDDANLTNLLDDVAHLSDDNGIDANNGDAHTGAPRQSDTDPTASDTTPMAPKRGNTSPGAPTDARAQTTPNVPQSPPTPPPRGASNTSTRRQRWRTEQDDANTAAPAAASPQDASNTPDPSSSRSSKGTAEQPPPLNTRSADLKKENAAPVAKPQTPDQPNIRLRPKKSDVIMGADGKPLDLKGDSFIVKGKDGRWYTADAIRTHPGRWSTRIVSRSGKNMGSFDTRNSAEVQRLQISTYEPPEFKEGDKVYISQFVEYQFDHSGTIQKIHPDGTMDILTDSTRRIVGKQKPNEIYMLDKDGNIVQKNEVVEQQSNAVVENNLNTGRRNTQTAADVIANIPVEATRGLSPEVQDSFQSFNLLDQMGQRSFQDVRDQIANYRYSDLVKHGDAHDRARSAMQTARNRIGPPRQIDYNDKPAIQQYLFDSVSDPTLHGALNPANTSPEATVNAGYQLSYGNLDSAANTPGMTTFWVNPHIEDVPETMKILDQCLAGCNAQIKVHVDTLVSEAGKASSDKIVVYFKTDDGASINAFARRLHQLSDQLSPHLQPESLTADISAFRIPLAPGITFVERPNGNSWDTNVGMMVPNFWGRQRMLSEWREQGAMPNLNEFRRASRIDNPNRNPSMPGLRRNASNEQPHVPTPIPPLDINASNVSSDLSGASM